MMIHTNVIRAYEPLLCTQSDKQGTNIHSHATYNTSVMTHPSNPPTSSFDPSHHPTNQKSQHRQASIFQQLMTEVIIGQGHQLPWQAWNFSTRLLGALFSQRFLHVLVGENEERMWNCPLDINIPLEKVFWICFGYVFWVQIHQIPSQRDV